MMLAFLIIDRNKYMLQKGECPSACEWSTHLPWPSPLYFKRPEDVRHGILRSCDMGENLIGQTTAAESSDWPELGAPVDLCHRGRKPITAVWCAWPPLQRSTAGCVHIRECFNISIIWQN